MLRKCFIIEDEPLAQDVLKKYITDYPLLQLCGVYKTAIEAQAQMQLLKPDLIFLDINLPILSGINFLKSLYNPPLVIFTTAYTDFALDGYELNAVDYLLKPFSFERFVKAANKALELARTKDTEHLIIETGFIFIKVDRKLVRINVADIVYVEALDDYVKIVTDSKEYLTNNTLKNMQQELPSGQFMRVHKSFLVATGKIEYIEGNFIKIVTAELPIGAVYKDDVLDLFKGKKK